MTPRQRLERLVEVLKHVEHGYNQEVLGWSGPKNSKDLLTYQKVLAEVGFIENKPMPETLNLPIPCHTQACALGWAALDPVLQAEGLAWRLSNSSKIYLNDMGDPFRYYEIQAVVEGRHIDIAKFFGLSNNYFFNGYYCTITQKIKQIQHLLDTGETVSPDRFLLEE